MIATSTRRSVTLALIAVLFGVLVILSAGLGSLHFHPGKPFPHAQHKPPVNVTPELTAPATSFIDVFRIIVLVLVIATGVVGVIGMILSPEFRRFLIRQLIPVGVILLAVYLLSLFIHPIQHVPVRPRPAPLPAPVTTPSPPVNISLPAGKPSHWWGVIIAFAAALLAVGAGAYGWRWVTTRRNRPQKDILRKLGEQADIAITRLRDGDDPRAVVLRCYQEMCDILHKYGHVANPAYFTPREFAHQLHARGMSIEYADRLTAIFEQVRYGARTGSGFAQEAIACLDAIKHMYAPA